MGNGKFRYFYTQEELSRYQKVKSVGDKIKDASGRKYYKEAEAAGKRLDTAKKEYKNASKTIERINETARSRSKKSGNALVLSKDERLIRKNAEQQKKSTAIQQRKAAYDKKVNEEKGAKTLYGASKRVKEAYEKATSEENKKSLNRTIKDVKKKMKKNSKKIKKSTKKTMKKIKKAFD